MGSFLKKFLGQNNYYSLKYSGFYSFYEKIFKPGTVEQQKKEIKLYQSFLSSCKLIFDIGANDGHKTAAFITISEKVICCEPDLYNFQLLRARFRKYKNKVVLLSNAVSDRTGVATLHIHHDGSAFNTLNKKWATLLEAKGKEYWDENIVFQSDREVELITLDNLIEQYGKPNFIKIDVEGSELQVLGGLSQKINWISFECLLPEFKNELIGCINHLEILDSNTKYNIINDEKVILKDYLSAGQLIDWLEKSDLKAFEILAKTI